MLAGGLADGSGGADLRTSSGGPRARQVLDERYAAGELSTQEYEERRAVLARGEDGS
ncbi:SHOCT domain-containing protein [Ornithinimicrobium kibberense]|uniref:SHOCT domain-containing protein n=1 Tax=Ornithinimicrobium kibberense TaxID=282060 RepID=UPI003621A658